MVETKGIFIKEKRRLYERQVAKDFVASSVEEFCLERHTSDLLTEI